jgi:hypothetical protein
MGRTTQAHELARPPGTRRRHLQTLAINSSISATPPPRVRLIVTLTESDHLIDFARPDGYKLRRNISRQTNAVSDTITTRYGCRSSEGGYTTAEPSVLDLTLRLVRGVRGLQKHQDS